jgi:hypothetical protein
VDDGRESAVVWHAVDCLEDDAGRVHGATHTAVTLRHPRIGNRARGEKKKKRRKAKKEKKRREPASERIETPYKKKEKKIGI